MTKRIPIYEDLEVQDLSYSEFNEELEIITESGKKFKEGVLGIVKAKTFFPNGYSRNKRFYPEELWENTINDKQTQDTINRGLMFGCIGHPENYSLDELLSSGAVSHKITKVWIDENKIGWTEAEILDTPAGRIMNTVLKSGSKPYVSTRGFGSFLSEKKVDDSGTECPIVNPDDFVVESYWDMVLNPGFLGTDLSLKENADDIQKLKESNCTYGCNFECLIEKVEDTEDKDEDASSVGDVGTSPTNVLANLSKDQLLDVIENLKKENEFLLEDSKDGDKEDDKEQRKISIKLLSSLELLSKLLKYNQEYSAKYTDIIELLDGSEISEDDFKKIEDLCGKLEKEEVDESLLKLVQKIKLLLNSSDKGDKKDKEDPIEEFVKTFYDNKKDLKFLEKCTIKLTSNLIEKSDDVEKLNKDIIAILSIKEQSSREREFDYIEKVNLIEEDFTTKFNIKEAEIKTLLEKLNAEKESKEVLENSITEKDNEIAKITDEMKTLEERLEALKQHFKELVEVNKSIKETFEDERLSLKEDNKSLSLELDKFKDEYNSLKETLSEKNKVIRILKSEPIVESKHINEAELTSLREEVQDYKIRTFQLMNKTDYATAKSVLEKHNFNEDVASKEIKSANSSNTAFGFDLKESVVHNKVHSKLNKLL